jgi:hypothetical protein
MTNDILLKEDDETYYNPDTLERYRLTKLKGKHGDEA